jgi:amino acid transporter
MKKNRSIAPFLKGLLNFTFYFGIIITLIISLFSFETISSMIIKISVMGIFLTSIYYLRKIVNTVIEKSPFLLENVKRFRRIGYLIFLLGLVDVISNFNKSEGSLLIGTPYGNIHTSVLLYFIIGGMAFILSEVFQLAVEIKKENDLTI